MSLKLDLGELEFKKEILDFKNGDGVKFFFYAGHGWNLKGKNYLFAIDAPQGGELLAGKEITMKNTRSVGCGIKRVE